MIVYIVPYATEYGGIQTFAKHTQTILSHKNITILNWQNPLKTLELIKHSIRLNTHRQIKKASFIHFWHPLCAIGYFKSNFGITCHGREILPSNLTRIQKKFMFIALKRARFIHANSQFTKQLITQYFPTIDSQKIKVLYPTIPDQPTPTKRPTHTPLVIGTLSRFNPRKNIPGIIYALNQLQKQSPNSFRFELIGRGITSALVKKALKSASFPYSFRTKIPNTLKRSILKKWDLLLLPTISLSDDVEGFGITYLEANALGIPVIASRVDGVPEAVADQLSGIFVDPLRPKTIATAIAKYWLSEKPPFNPYAWAAQFFFSAQKNRYRQFFDQAYA